MPASDLLRLVEALGAPYGLERSFKITPGELVKDRYLLSVGRAALGDAPVERLLHIGQKLYMPVEIAEQVPASLERADIVHFGYEYTAQRHVYKVYFEYMSQVRQAMAEGGADPVLVHVAYKWVPLRADDSVITRYTWVPCPTRSAIAAKLRDLVPAVAASRALRCVLGLVSRIDAVTDTGELLLMDVEESGSARRSCDLNVYDAGLRIRDIADLLDAAIADFAVPEIQSRAIVENARDRALGHVSAGLGRDGQEFVTIYFGVEAH